MNTRTQLYSLDYLREIEPANFEIDKVTVGTALLMSTSHSIERITSLVIEINIVNINICAKLRTRSRWGSSIIGLLRRWPREYEWGCQKLWSKHLISGPLVCSCAAWTRKPTWQTISIGQDSRTTINKLSLIGQSARSNR
jgi:hypothetical protein